MNELKYSLTKVLVGGVGVECVQLFKNYFHCQALRHPVNSKILLYFTIQKNPKIFIFVLFKPKKDGHIQSPPIRDKGKKTPQLK